VTGQVLRPTGFDQAKNPLYDGKVGFGGGCPVAALPIWLQNGQC
jgi:hypothetical protein